MSELRDLMHDMMNYITIAQGMAKSVQNGLEGKSEQTPEQRLTKLTKALKAMENIEEAATKMRNIIREQDL